jgi:hypothetical protein
MLTLIVKTAHRISSQPALLLLWLIDRFGVEEKSVCIGANSKA